MNNQHSMTPDEVQVLENVLRDTATDGFTRRTLLRRAAVTAAVASVAAPAEALAQGGSSGVSQIVNRAITAEALAVTYLTGLIENASKTGVSKFVPVLKAANAAEYDHYKVLKSLGPSRSRPSSGPRTPSSSQASPSRCSRSPRRCSSTPT